MSEEQRIEACQAVPCHCYGMEAKHIVTYKNGEEKPVSDHCSWMHIMAGLKSRPITATRPDREALDEALGLLEWFANEFCEYDAPQIEQAEYLISQHKKQEAE